MKKVLSIILAVAMLLTSTYVVFAAGNGGITVVEDGPSAYGDLMSRRGGTTPYFDAITVLAESEFDVNADLFMEEINLRYRYEYEKVLELFGGKSEQIRQSKVTGGFTFVMDVPEGITIPDSVLNGTNMDGFVADLDMWEEVSRGFNEDTDELWITVKVKDGITAGKLYDNADEYLGDMVFTGKGFKADETGDYVLNGSMEATDGSGFVVISTPKTAYGIQITTDAFKQSKGIKTVIHVIDDEEKVAAIIENEKKVAENEVEVAKAVQIAVEKLREYLQSEEYDVKRDTEIVLKKKFIKDMEEELEDSGINYDPDIFFEGLDIGRVISTAEVAVFEGDGEAGTYVERINVNTDYTDVNMIPQAIKKAQEILDSKKYPSSTTVDTLKAYLREIEDAIKDMGVTVTCIPELNPVQTTSSTGTAIFNMTFSDGGAHRDQDVSVLKVVDKKSTTPGGGGGSGGGYNPISSIINNENNTTDYAPIPDELNGDDHILYIIGYEDGTSRPENNISRAEVATIFYRLLKPAVRNQYYATENKFSDVSADDWFNAEVSTMANLGIVKGRSETEFEPNEPITRAEYAAICARFDKSAVSGTSNFTDIAGHWAKAEIDRVAQIGWILGYSDNTFRPDVNIIRAEAITLTNRVLHRLPESEADLLPGMITFPDNQPSDWFYLAVQEASNAHNFERKSDGLHEKWTSLK